jgi:hypothetical protein
VRLDSQQAVYSTISVSHLARDKDGSLGLSHCLMAISWVVRKRATVQGSEEYVLSSIGLTISPIPCFAATIFFVRQG